MTVAATLRFHGDLPAFAPGARVEVPVADRTRSVKDAVESCGVPHTEVDLLLVDGVSVGFAAQLRGGETVDVHPPETAADTDAPSRVRPPPLPGDRFLLDVHLGRLAERLRLLGFDAGYRNDAVDADLAATAARERRWLLSCDRGLLMRSAVTHGYLLRSRAPREQVVEVLDRFELRDRIAPFTRCVRCNDLLEPVEKAATADRLEPGTRRHHDAFVRCRGCDRLYWEGSHHEALRTFVAEARGG